MMCFLEKRDVILLLITGYRLLVKRFQSKLHDSRLESDGLLRSIKYVDITHSTLLPVCHTVSDSLAHYICQITNRRFPVFFSSISFYLLPLLQRNFRGIFIESDSESLKNMEILLSDGASHEKRKGAESK